MKKFFCVALAATLALLTGCIVLSVYPFYTVKDLAYDPSMIGVWTNAQSNAEIWKFEPGETNSHALTYASVSETNSWWPVVSYSPENFSRTSHRSDDGTTA